ncbi:MAG: hypothetical protein ACE5LV_04835 [Candidatus Aminicenantales bacterium]
MDDILIIGSGISGVSAALRFADKGIRIAMLDVGLEPRREQAVDQNFYDYCEKNDGFSLMIGLKFEGLRNLDPMRRAIPVKLAAPRMAFVLDRAQNLSPVRERDYCLIQSFAQGGLANAWGAGLMRYTEKDLREFPIREEDLAPYYERLSGEIGISGENDDLTCFFGKDKNLQKPLRLSNNARFLYMRYLKKKKNLNRRGVFLGRPRLAVLSEEKEGRKPCDYSNLEFWQPHLPYIYYPSLTLQKLVRQGFVDYRKGYLAESWSHSNGKILVRAKSLEDHRTQEFPCRRLVLAAGAVGSAKLALASKRDFRSVLSLLDNTALQFPFLIPRNIGRKLERNSFGLTQLSIVFDWESQEGQLQGSLLDLTSPARAEFFSYFPFAARDNVFFLKYILPAMMVMQLYLPVSQETAASLSLREDGSLEIIGKGKDVPASLIRKVLKAFRKLGAYSASSLVVRVENGLGIHYAGTLPMRESPEKPYESSRWGELFDEPHVYAVDGSVFPRLSAMNYAFAVMANAMRIADHIVSTLKR